MNFESTRETETPESVSGGDIDYTIDYIDNGITEDNSELALAAAPYTLPQSSSQQSVNGKTKNIFIAISHVLFNLGAELFQKLETSEGTSAQNDKKPKRYEAKILVPCSRSAVFNFEFAFENCY